MGDIRNTVHSLRLTRTPSFGELTCLCIQAYRGVTEPTGEGGGKWEGRERGREGKKRVWDAEGGVGVGGEAPEKERLSITGWRQRFCWNGHSTLHIQSERAYPRYYKIQDTQLSY